MLPVGLVIRAVEVTLFRPALCSLLHTLTVIANTMEAMTVMDFTLFISS